MATRWGVRSGVLLLGVELLFWGTGVCANGTGGGGLARQGMAGGCQRAVLEGEVQAGSAYVHPLGGGLEVMLEPLASGWLLRVLPRGVPRGAHDYAELATPPYAAVNALLISTDFSFRAQDAVAWNPRRFRFAANTGQFVQMLEAYERYRRAPTAAGAENELADKVSQAPEGMLEILDAKLVPGRANQGRMAAAVASHFSTTAHTIEEPPAGGGTALGRLSWMRFRISLDLPDGFRVDRGIAVLSRPCSKP